MVGFRETAQIGNTLKYRNSSEDMDLVSHIKISYHRIGFRETGHIGNTLTGNSSFYMELTIIKFISNDRLIIREKRQIGKLLSNQDFRAQNLSHELSIPKEIVHVLCNGINLIGTPT